MSSASPDWESGHSGREPGRDREPAAGGRRQSFDGSRFVAFLFADLRGFTAYTAAHGPDAAAQLAAAFAGITGDVVTGRGGLVVGTWGDEVLAEFPSARDAVRAALDLQQRCRSWTVANPGAPLAAGIGLDVGEPAEAEQLRASEALNLAARLCAVAGAGEVLASRELMHLAGGMRGEITGKTRRLRLKGVGGRTVAVAVTRTELDDVLERKFRAVLAGLPAARRRRRRQRATIAAALVVAVVAAVTAGWLASFAPRPGAPRIPGQALGAIDGHDGRLLGTLRLTGAPGAVAASPDGGQVWVTEPAAGIVEGVDTSTRHVFQTIPGQSDPRAVAVEHGYVWIVEGATGAVREYTTTGQPVASYQVGTNPSAIAFGFGAVWVTNQGEGTLTRITAGGTKGTRHAIPVGAAPTAVTAGDSAVWVANRGFNTITPVDPRTLRPGPSIHVGAGPVSIATAGGRVWVADALDGTVDRIAPATGTVTGTRVGQLPAAVAAGPDSVWVGNVGDGTVARLDPRTGQVSGHPLFVGSAPYGLALTGSTLWVATQTNPALAHRGGTLTIGNVGGGYDQLGPGAIDPSTSYWWGSWSALALVYDGLVGWNRATGVASTQLVPDLAVSLPTPSDGGRSYRFVLRRGIRFSNGVPLHASDIRRGLKRNIIISDATGAGRHYTDIIGAADCPGHPHRCHLRAGIQTDDAAGTVTFHLTRPDPDFVASLATGPFAAAVPPGTPLRGPLNRPIPGTGPYKISRYVPAHEGRKTTASLPADALTLVRNPYFPQSHPWSLAAQPGGYVDKIRWVPEPSVRAALAATLAGRIDVAYPSTAQLSALTATQRARQLHIPPSLLTDFVILNAAAPPFNNRTARQAAATALTGDPAFARIENDHPTCTLVPPHFLGYSPGCAHRRDLATAKHLVVSSGTAGDRVHVYVFPLQPVLDVGRHIRDVMQRIGYRADLRPENSYWSSWNRYSRHRPVNAEPYGWAADFFSASQFYQPLLNCHDGQFLQLGGCNKHIDAVAKRAFRLQLTAPSTALHLWQTIYHRVNTDARIIPTDRSTATVVLLSTRTGNYAPNPATANAPMLDQLWVK